MGQEPECAYHDKQFYLFFVKGQGLPKQKNKNNMMHGNDLKIHIDCDLPWEVESHELKLVFCGRYDREDDFWELKYEILLAGRSGTYLNENKSV